MKAKPAGVKSRNLYVVRGAIWYGRVVAGRRYRVNTKFPDTDAGWKDARLFRDEYEHQKGVGRSERPRWRGADVRRARGALLRRAEVLQLKPTTQADRRSHLAAGGPLLPALGRKRIDEITPDTLVAWWERESKARGWCLETGFRYLATVAEVLKQGRAFMQGRALATKEARGDGEERRTAGGPREAAETSGRSATPRCSPG